MSKQKTVFRPRPLNHYLNALKVYIFLVKSPDLQKAIREISEILKATAKQWPKFFTKPKRYRLIVKLKTKDFESFNG